jgi:hypothetical protein
MEARVLPALEYMRGWYLLRLHLLLSYILRQCTMDRFHTYLSPHLELIFGSIAMDLAV